MSNIPSVETTLDFIGLVLIFGLAAFGWIATP